MEGKHARLPGVTTEVHRASGQLGNIAIAPCDKYEAGRAVLDEEDISCLSQHQHWPRLASGTENMIADSQRLPPYRSTRLSIITNNRIFQENRTKVEISRVHGKSFPHLLYYTSTVRECTSHTSITNDCPPPHIITVRSL